ncbi:hypothetical protein Tco_1042049, partial [Tanacetum coccineum]
DLFIFIRGDLESTRVIMDSLEEFKLTSGLVPSIPNSTAYFCNVINHVKLSILKYLGVLLISSRLFNKDCKVLVEKAKNKIMDWKNKSLSFAGRFHLCKSVISSMHVYWASVLMIPKGIIYDIHHLIRGFLWCNGEYKRRKAKVAWEHICKNWQCVSTSLWYDNCCSSSPLIRFLSHKDITNEGFHIQTKVADLVLNGNWIWPQSWTIKASNLGQIVVPNIVDSRADEMQ